MTIDELLQNRISPFDTDDGKLRKLFIYFCYDSPTLKTAGLLPPKDASVPKASPTSKADVNDTSSDAGNGGSRETILQQRWDSFITEFNNNVNPCKLYASSRQNLTDDYDKHGLGNSCVVSRRFKGYVCTLKVVKYPLKIYVRHT